ncbi:MAG: hypothetical protein GX111_10530 [Clostridiales bacterium]|nr:hypothetical protein [Clostridiales bacterium]
MKKHIIIAGVPRSGKSTVSSLISKTCGYQHISMDSIVAGFENCFPELGINTYADMPSTDILFNISGKIAPFIQEMIKSGEYTEIDTAMVIDIYQLLPEDYIRFIDRSHCDIYYLGTADVTPEERFRIQKKYDTPKDYTYYLPDEEIREGCVSIVEQSKLIKEQCIKYNLPYYETSKYRERVIKTIMQRIMR